MARIRGVTKDLAAPEVRELFENQEKLYGKPLNPAAVYALRPSIWLGTQALASGIRESGLLEPSLKHLVSLRTALINGCAF